MATTQCEKRLPGDKWFSTTAGYHGHRDTRQCKRRATVGENYCHQHGGGRCHCARYENHSGGCRGPSCNCHG